MTEDGPSVRRGGDVPRIGGRRRRADTRNAARLRGRRDASATPSASRSRRPCRVDAKRTPGLRHPIVTHRVGTHRLPRDSTADATPRLQHPSHQTPVLATRLCPRPAGPASAQGSVLTATCHYPAIRSLLQNVVAWDGTILVSYLTPSSAAGPHNNATGERSEPVALLHEARRQQRPVRRPVRCLTVRVMIHRAAVAPLSQQRMHCTNAKPCRLHPEPSRLASESSEMSRG